MKPFIIALTLYLFVNISSCSTNDAPIVEPPNGETAEDSNTPTMNEQIRIIIGNASFTATLEDNATTKAFKASLPITVNMTEQAGNESLLLADSLAYEYCYARNNLRWRPDAMGQQLSRLVL